MALRWLVALLALVGPMPAGPPLLAFAGRPGPEPLYVTRPVVALDGTEVLVSFTLQNAFDAEIEARIRSGLATRFTYELQLMRDRKHWWDEGFDETTLEVTTMYNAVADEYLVNTKRDGRLVESRLARSPAELAGMMTRFESLRLFSVAGVPAGTRMLVRARAEIGSRTWLSLVPVRLGTGWVESRKFRVPRS